MITAWSLPCACTGVCIHTPGSFSVRHTDTLSSVPLHFSLNLPRDLEKSPACDSLQNEITCRIHGRSMQWHKKTCSFAKYQTRMIPGWAIWPLLPLHSFAISVCAWKIFYPLILFQILKRSRSIWIAPDCLHKSITELSQEKLSSLEKGICFLTFLPTLEFLLQHIWPAFSIGGEVNYCPEEFRNGVCCAKRDTERLNGIE